ncbi:MAG: nuclear transport factor 2 family protein [Bryobacteraceae bacterium]
MTRLLVSIAVLTACACDVATVESAQVEGLEKQWVSAVVNKDIPALDRLLSPDLLYGHASGVLDTKASYLEKLKSGAQVYRSLEQRKLEVRMHGSTAVTHSWVHVTGTNPQGEFDDKIMMLHVWINEGGSWKLAGHQTARVDKLPD